MFGRLTTRFGARLLVALLALGIVTGGTATAAKLITGKNVKNGSLTGADLKNGSVGSADLSKALKSSLAAKGGPAGPAGPAGPKGDSGPQGPAGTPNGYTKSEADAAFLGKSAKAADANMLDGVDGDDMAAGDAAISWAAATRAFDSPEFALVTLPGVGRLDARCGAAGAKLLTFENLSSGPIAMTRNMVRDGSTALLTKAPYPVGIEQNVATSPDNYEITLQALRGPETGLASADFVTMIVTAHDDDGGECTFNAQVIANERDAKPLVINP